MATETCSNLQSSILSIFRRFGPFPKDFGQVEGLLMLELNKIIRASYVVMFPITFFCFMSEVGREEFSKL